MCRTVLTLIICVVLSSVSSNQKIKENYGPKIREIQRKNLQQYIDRSVEPCDNFWEFSCGNWLNVQASDSSSYNDLKIILEDVDLMINESLNDVNFLSSFEKDHPVLMAKEYYDSCMDVEKITKRGWHPIIDFLNSSFDISALDIRKKNNYDWIIMLASLRRYGGKSVISSEVDRNYYKSNMYTLYLDQPEKEVNLLQGGECYVVYDMIKQFGLSHDLANDMSRGVCKFGRKLQNLFLYEKDRPHRSLLFKKVEFKDVNKMYQNLNLQRYVTIATGRSFKPTEEVFLNHKYLRGLDNLVAKTHPNVIVSYALMQFIFFVARDYVNEDNSLFRIYDDRWQKCVKVTTLNMDMAIANIFVRKFLRSKKRIEVENLVDDIKRKFSEVISQTDWLHSKTKRNAVEKLDKMCVEIGFPKFILKRSHLKRWFRGANIDKDDFFMTSISLIQLREERQLKLVGTLAKNDLHDEPVTTVSANYDIGNNKITIMSGILQLPFYHHAYPAYMKYGVMGSIIGHEIVHAFDNLGRLHDSKGNVENWWTKDSLSEYNKRSECLITQYNNLGVDGFFTLPENIADNGGLKIAYLAYMDWLEKNKNDVKLMKRETIQGSNFTSTQLFFIAFTQWRCEYVTQYWTSKENKIDPHPREEIRVLASLSNSEYFGKSFKCNSNDKLNPIKKCSVW